ncbi:MAG: ammonia-forming cytochrome c nitrite reductase subunit c552 [Chloroflexota bacterium]
MQYSNHVKWFRVGLFLAAILVVAGLWFGSVDTPQAQAAPSQQSDDPTPTPEPESGDGADDLSVPTDHHDFEILQQDFDRPQDVTKACLSCHEEAAKEVQHTTHWTWEFVNETTGQTLGKKTLVNNFCINVNSNEPRCTSCHVGYGWTDDSYDFSIQENVDCLVCHDTTGTYKKTPTGAGMPSNDLSELTAISQAVGLTSRETCGACHFYGGGGDEVKHGDLDSSLINPDFDLDVHMDAEGLDFSCTTCHETTDHDIPGSRYSMDLTQWDGCESCHTEDPHAFDVLNGHSDRVSCETCHVPEYARGDIATKMTWDWSTAGKFNDDGSNIVTKDDNGNIIYHTLKGDFTWEEDVIPEYVWFNGNVTYTLLGDTIDPSQIVSINHFEGSVDDPVSKIWPVKRFVAVQPYDSVNNTLVVPHLFGKDDTAYWANFDWNNAINAGMDYMDLPYSGEYDFVETEMYWPITHMIAPADQALACDDCHIDEGGRLDFVALGYSEEDAHRLTNFPPTVSLTDMENVPVTSPSYCAQCHSMDLSDHQVEEMVVELAAQLTNQQADREEPLTDEEIQHQAESMAALLIERGGQYELWHDSRHGEAGVGCVSCHVMEGEGDHPLMPYSVDKSAEVCGACHLDEYRDWEDSAHANPGGGKDQIACVDCHQPHDQGLRLINGDAAVCQNCHQDESMEMAHSTHAINEDLSCIDCHKNTEHNTGHNFMVESDTCILCHGETIHADNKIALASAESVVVDPQPADEEEIPCGAVLGIPSWALILIGVGVGLALYWVAVGKEPGEDHLENQDKEDK